MGAFEALQPDIEKGTQWGMARAQGPRTGPVAWLRGVHGMDTGLVQAELEPGILDMGMKAKGGPQIREIF